MKNQIIVLALLCCLAIYSHLEACGLLGRKCAAGRSCHPHTSSSQQHVEQSGKSEKEARPLVFGVFKDSLGEWRWHLKAGNGEIIADSGEGYLHRGDCLHAIDLIKSKAAGAVVK